MVIAGLADQVWGGLRVGTSGQRCLLRGATTKLCTDVVVLILGSLLKSLSRVILVRRQPIVGRIA